MLQPDINCCQQAESLIDDTESLFDLKRIVIRSLILLVCGRKEVCTCLYASQVEINGYLLLGSAGDGCSGPFSDDAISVLITSDCYKVLAGQAEARQDDRQVYARSREQYSLQLAWLLAAIGGRIPEIDSFRDRLGLCERLLLLALITRPCNESDNEDDARSACKCPGQLPSRRLALLPERQQVVHAVGARCRVIDPRIR